MLEKIFAIQITGIQASLGWIWNCGFKWTLWGPGNNGLNVCVSSKSPAQPSAALQRVNLPSDSGNPHLTLQACRTGLTPAASVSLGLSEEMTGAEKLFCFGLR